jgi:penicillin-binding protein 1A
MPPAQAGRARPAVRPTPLAPAARRPGTPSAPRPQPARGAPPRRAGGGWPRRLLRWGVLLAVWGGVALALLLLVLAWDLPRPEAALAATTRRPSVTLLAADGSMLATQGDLFGEAVRLRDLPPHLPAALLAVEDRRFYRHPGLDPVGIARAAWANWRAGEVVQGGSTLTQQLAKNLFLTPERTLRRKGQEALLALWLERRFSKHQLLEVYLNRVYLGAGAHGVDAAARLFFGVPARRLAVWQAAMLAGLPKAPSRLNPRASPDLAAARAAEVLEAMVETGVLTRAAMDAELARMRGGLAFRPALGAGWFADWALDGLADRFPGNADLVLRATLDPRLQAAVEARLAALLDGPVGARAGVSQGAVVVLDAATGAVRAMAGGRDYRQSQFNRATLARRQPGSAFKPFVFLAALEHGMRPEDPVADGPIALGGWSPGNGPAWRARGEVTLEEALAHSVNTAAVRVLLRAGGARGAAEVARRLGVEGRFPEDASLALGTGEVTLLDLTAAYAAFANGGRRVEPFGIAAAAPSAGSRAGRAVAPLGARTTPPRPVVAPEHAAAMRRMLEAAVARGTGRAAAVPGRAVAGKTGTTQDFRDAWFVGFAARGGQGGGAALAIGVWLGNDDGRPMEDVRGGTLPARLFREVLEAAAP